MNKHADEPKPASRASLPFAERDTLHAIEPPFVRQAAQAAPPTEAEPCASSNDAPTESEPGAGSGVLREALGNTAPPSTPNAAPLPATAKEHGVWGTTAAAVGGFGEDYDAQIAHGTEPDLPTVGPADGPLEREVRKTLGRAHVDAADLRVAVRGDHVTLYGTVRKSLEKAQIEARTRSVPGVASITSHLHVQDPDAPES